MRSIGAIATEDHFGSIRVAHDFDALVWGDSTSASVPLPEK